MTLLRYPLLMSGHGGGGFTPVPRTYAGNMCGVRVEGLAPVAGGARDPSLVLSWFYDRYGAADRAKIRAAWRPDRYPDVLLSWPDSRFVGASPQSFADTCRELIANGFRPAVMLCSKVYDPSDFPSLLANIQPVVAPLSGLVGRIGIGWELSIWLTPTVVQQLIDALAPQFVSYGAKVYVHFQEGYSSFQQPGQVFASFWNGNVGKLTGLFKQKILAQSPTQYWYDSGGIWDVLTRFAGNYGVSPDSGFGHPFDDIELEITATDQFNGNVSEETGNWWGQRALTCPAASGPAGAVTVMGSGNGQ